MSRHLFLLGLIAVPAVALTACENPSTLAKAKPGECYSVVGKDGMGKPRFAKTACAGSPAALAAACPAPATPAPAAAACPTTTTKVTAGGHQASSRQVKARASTRRVQTTRYARVSGSTSQASGDDRVAKSGEVTSLGIEYARVGEELAGGYERRESYGRFDYGPPPPPPPPAAVRRHAEASIGYAERSRQSRAYSESYSSSASSSWGGYGRAECDCEGGRRGQPPHSPFDGYGYLTWRGKTPG